MITTQEMTTIAGVPFPVREGDATATVGPMPHRQKSERASEALQDSLVDSINAVDGITVADRGGFVGRPFIGASATNWNAHVHYYEDGAHQDGSMHIAMPQNVSAEIEAAGWGERHPAFPSAILLYSPRNEAEVAVITDLVKVSYEFAQR